MARLTPKRITIYARPQEGSKVEWDNRHHSLGVSIGMISGIGFCYRTVSIKKGFGFQASVGYITGIVASVGGQLTYTIYTGDSRFYILGGVGYYRRNLLGAPENPILDMGIGMGVEFTQSWVSKQFTMVAELTSNLIFVPNKDPFVIPLPQFGFYYYFK